MIECADGWRARRIILPVVCVLLMSGCGGLRERAASAPAGCEMREVELAIPQVDYEHAIYYAPGDPIPHLDLEKVDWDSVVEKKHRAVVIENEYLRLTLVPETGKIHSMVYLPTGHETLWRNDIVKPGGAANDAGWWIWSGGIEYTLPGDEHGTTWALPWTFELLDESPERKAVRMEVTEPTTGLRERVDISMYPGVAGFEADIRIWNPGTETVTFAHWINPMWAPGGRNEVTDNTELLIPTDQIVIEKRWQKNLGPSPQPWPDNPLRFIRNWKMGDIQADGLTAGFFGVYSHDAEEGVVRVFDPLSNSGVDTWTYGFHPADIPMGSGAPNKGYVEMWGGTVKTFPDERRPLGPGESLAWTEWMYPFQKTGGLTYANQFAAVRFVLGKDGREAALAICPASALERAVAEVRVGGRVVSRLPFRAAPDAPFEASVSLEREAAAAEALLILERDGVEFLRCRPGR